MVDEPRNGDGARSSKRSDGEPDGPRLRVVDRRWWATGEVSADAGEADAAAWEPRKPTQVEELERQLADKNQLLQTYMTQYKQAVAEFEDVKARIRRDVSKDVERGRRAMLVELVDILDNLERAIEAGRDTANVGSLMQGLDMVERSFTAKLDAFGVKRINAIGQPFDPAAHEAVSTVPTADAAEDGTVVGIVRAGYTIGADVLRPALVAVAKLAVNAQ